MIKETIYIKDKWKIILFIDIDYDRYDIIESALTDLLAPTKTIDDIYNKIGYKYDCGFTYSDFYYRTSVVGINKTTSRREMINTISHELDHVQADICNYYEINLNSEDAAYLMGYLMELLYLYCYKCFCY